MRKIKQLQIYMHLKQRHKLHEAKTETIEGKNRQFNNSRWRPKYFSFNND